MERYIICPSCKDHNTLDSNFCKTCGTQLIFFNEKPSSKAKQNPISHDAAVTIITAEYSYEGQSINNAANGKGKGVFRDGKVYVGEWKNGVIHGKGEMRYPNGDVYSGEWNNNQICGQGVCQYQDGRKYNGHWKNNQKDGKGVFTWPNGDKYDGYWVKDQFSGIGTYYYADGKKYCGDWLNHKKNGKGIMTWVNGSSYDGAWENDNISGIGTYTYADGAKYTGEWKNNKRHGKGILLESNGKSYEGEWLNGKRSGFGIMTYADGSKYEGQWENDLRNGNGILIHASGEKEEGSWKDGKIILPPKEEGIIIPQNVSVQKENNSPLPEKKEHKVRNFFLYTFVLIVILAIIVVGIHFVIRGIVHGVVWFAGTGESSSVTSKQAAENIEQRIKQFIKTDASLLRKFPPVSFDLTTDTSNDNELTSLFLFLRNKGNDRLTEKFWVALYGTSDYPVAMTKKLSDPSISEEGVHNFLSIIYLLCISKEMNRIEPKTIIDKVEELSQSSIGIWIIVTFIILFLWRLISSSRS